ncbi:tyrosine-protein phosphatase non-receptor type 2 isoform X1 [Canis lupus baileyi]|uniref:Tyrosine-protein phosphatase non-receptor type n=3 Tax=Canis lupus TaxID=9612 RepID=A0A8I3MZ64_CANLF|nr:tyrosine-protein phosphatase non-receptor type 2 isoform X1 [Canis lupus familiaris]XP_025285373.1 tyrosine-protein phosphatase non-receptor type 2 isoform X1 [Canis lupus dingo]XP_038399854.1 tyrosine-protein phosphatase non-receptor type 2 isoform X1 [Canis lupus familiaris]XP_038528657.1 tyrosine-protein phosphatase non-receptor type 2 isoform X1 [Canis lupus familiaris]|eukprot:XP_005623156.1 tyrosine-protein phosphatase non-receptor type 2 isoform X1 [Canis lupus familiaris]
MSATVEREFEELDAQNRWQQLYLEIRNESHDYPHRVAKFPENRNRNRYRDVSPYDHSRVKLQNAENDYINASLVDIEEAQRSYILTQGPLPNTGCHFWLMVWQQKTKAVVMLNRVVEKESVKCAQYWPTKDDPEMLFKETGFSVKFLSEDVKSYYTVHLLQLENINSGETRTISHFHYTTWPDFGVPESPASFLNFLFKVRESGSLNPEHGPAVIHCSAGIGRSGTFSLVDTCLVLMEKGDDINIKQLLLNMRKYRMGLIQTPDQLRFSYMTIIEGAKFIKGDSNIQKRWKELSKEDLCPAFDHSPTKIMTEKYNGNRIGLEEEKLTGDRYTGLSSKIQDTTEENSESVLRKRIREDRKANTAQKVQQMKQRLNETERKRKRWLYWQPILTKMGFVSFILVGAFVGWTLLFQQNVL